MTEHLRGPRKFVLAGSGHIAGVVNPPAAKKYQYWTNAEPAESLESFLENAVEHAGSWWPDWVEWLTALDGAKVAASGARIPGCGNLCAVAEAPGEYVRTR